MWIGLPELSRRLAPPPISHDALVGLHFGHGLRSGCLPAEDSVVVRTGPWRALRLLTVLVLAFADNKRGLLPNAGLLRGMAIRFSYRWAAGQVLADGNDKAVLLWSPLTPDPNWRARIRTIASVLFAAMVELTWSVLSGAPIALLINGLLRISRLRIITLRDVLVVVVAIRSSDAVARGIRAYQYHQSMIRGLPPATSSRWCIDSLAAVPAGRGHGGRLLETFLARADALTVETVLHCATRHLAFYRRYGFHLICSSPGGGQHVMARPATTPRRSSPDDGLTASVHDRPGSFPPSRHSSAPVT
jgi:GNAT superfamily N-acetyltransferase